MADTKDWAGLLGAGTVPSTPAQPLREVVS
jgi:hypothetical protein